MRLSGDSSRPAEFGSALAQVALDVALRSNHQNMGASLGGPLIGALLTALRSATPEARPALEQFLKANRGNTNRDGLKPHGGSLDELLAGGEFKVVGIDVIQTPHERKPIDKLGEKPWEVSRQLETAGREELLPLAEQLSRLDTSLLNKQKILTMLPELATPEYLERSLLPTEDSLQTVGAFYGPSVMLDRYLETPKIDGLASRDLLGYVQDAGFKPSAAQVDGLVSRICKAMGPRTDERDYSHALELLDAIALNDPSSVTLEQRARLQDGLISCGKNALGLVLWSGPAGRLAAGHRDLIAPLLARGNDPVAHGLLLSAPLTDEEFAATSFCRDVESSHQMVSFSRSLRGLSGQEALALLEGSGGGTMGGTLVFRHLVAQAPYPQLETLKDYETEPLQPYLFEGLRAGQDRLPEVEATLARYAADRLCSETLVGKLCEFTSAGISLTETARRFDVLEQPRRDATSERLALTTLALVGSDVEGGQAFLAPLRARFEDWEVERSLRGLPAGLRQDWGLELFGRVMADSATLAEGEAAFKTLEGAGAAGLARFQDVRAARPAGACAVFPAAWGYSGDDWPGALGGLQRLAGLSSDESYAGMAAEYFAHLNEGASVEGALDRVLRRQIAGPETASAAIGQQGDRVVVGGAMVRRRTTSL